MITRRVLSLCVLATIACSGDDNSGVEPRPVPVEIAAAGGNEQVGAPATALASPLRVLVTTGGGDPVSGVAVTWSVITGGGTVSPGTSLTGTDGVASAQFTLGPAVGDQQAQAVVVGLRGSPVVFTATASTDPLPPPPSGFTLTVAGGGNNVPNRYSSDLWVHGGYAYTGTWGGSAGSKEVGQVLNVWQLDAAGAPTLKDSIKTAGIGTVSDVEVSSDGLLLMFSAEGRSEPGLYLFSLANPLKPAFLSRAVVPDGIHTATFGEIAGRRYAFAARNPPFPALLIYDVTDASSISLVATVPVRDNYGIHDTFVRNGLAFVFVWDEGFIIYDVGNGIRGGSPGSPVEISRLVTPDGDAGSPSVHNGWWFHNPVSGERRYLFIGQEGPSVLGSRASGDIFAVDVSDLARPRQVAYFHLDGAGAHNFWMDEPRQILYAAYYNGGVVALDVSGTLSGDLSNRLLGRVQPGGPGNTFTWGVQLANGSLYASDMISGLWQLKTE